MHESSTEALVHPSCAELPTLERMVALADEPGSVRLSIYLPLGSPTPADAKTRVRAKNLLREAQRALRSTGVTAAEADAMLRETERVVDDARLFATGGGGVVIFAGRNRLHHFRVPGRVPQLLALGNRFKIGPLLPFYEAGGAFYVLGLNQQEIRLWKGNRQHIEPVPLDGHALAPWLTMPRQHEPQVHAFLADRGGTGARAVFHGAGGNGDEGRTHMLATHLHGVDRALNETLRAEQSPVVLAGVRHITALYREVSRYPHVLEEGIDGQPRDLPATRLHEQAWSLVEPVLAREHDRVVDRFHQLRGTGLTAEGARQTLRAAEAGKVDTLLIAAEAAARDSVPAEGMLVRFNSVPRPTEQLEMAAIRTVRQSGTLLVLPTEQMPDDTAVCAILRY